MGASCGFIFIERMGSLANTKNIRKMRWICSLFTVLKMDLWVWLDAINSLEAR